MRNLTCPEDGSTMNEGARDGVPIDVCPKCRGVWLDRGELDKLLEPVYLPDDADVAHETVQAAASPARLFRLMPPKLNVLGTAPVASSPVAVKLVSSAPRYPEPVRTNLAAVFGQARLKPGLRAQSAAKGR